MKALSPDLCDAWTVGLAQPLAPGARAGYPNLYRRTDDLCGGPAYEALSTAEWGKPASEAAPCDLEVQGLSADGSTLAFLASGGMAGSGSPGLGGAEHQLYVRAGGSQPLFACVLPDRAPLAGSCSAGRNGPGEADVGFGRLGRLQGALSSDGRRLFWSTGVGDGKIYLRQNPTAPESAREHGAATGTGTVVGEASAKGRVLASHHDRVDNLSEVTGGFVPGQQVSDSAAKIPAGARILECLPDCEEPTELVLDREVSGNSLSDEIAGHPSATVFHLAAQSGAFEAGQSIEGPGIPPGTTVEATDAGEGALTLSAQATETVREAPLAATSPCTEAAAKACTIAVSEPGEALSGSTASQFRAASTDGSVAIYTSGKAGGEDLYEARAQEAAGRLEVAATTRLAHQTIGVMGVSQDASHVYFASREAIAGSGKDTLGEEAEAGDANLYLWHEGDYAFVGVLSDRDAISALPSPIGAAPFANLARIEGSHAAFLSSAPLTGYDNADAATGEPDTEVFLYDAAANRLVCASCNPSGGRPAGRRERWARKRFCSTARPGSPPGSPATRRACTPRASSPPTGSACSSTAPTRSSPATPTVAPTSMSGRPRERGAARPPPPHTAPQTAAAWS